MTHRHFSFGEAKKVIHLLSIDFLRERLTPEQLEDLSLTIGMCLECGGQLKRSNGEVVCGECGRVWSVENVDDNVPFPEDEDPHFEGHWQPGSSLCFLKGLGDPALDNNRREKGLMRILAQAPARAEDLGIRARQIKVMAYLEDPQQLRRVLNRISLLLDKLGHRENHEMADYVGNLARKIVAFALTANINVPTRIADAIVHHATRKFQLKQDGNGQTLKFKEEDLQFVEWFEEATHRLKLKEAKAH